MDNQLMSAADKRRLYETGQTSAMQAELYAVTEKINKAQGLSIYLDRQLTAPVVTILEGKGYKCFWEQIGINESAYKVSW